MQAQQTRNITQAITHTQSLAAVQTLLRAGLGCITFLRNLLPDDNFTQSHFTSIDESTSSEVSLSQPDGSQDGTTSGRTVNGFKVMTISRGYTDEADKILNYLEYGIFDALEKRYLRSFIFAIYLDNREPNNIVEAYTFNFKYHAIPGSDVLMPIMSLSDGKNVPLNQKKANAEDPVAKAIRKGKVPTLKDVKMSVKAMLKTLISAMHRMDDLPRRRFATFKIFYTDDTPSDYEPPNFQAGDADKDKWFFMTHELDEMPDRCSIGKIDTGHHSVKLSVTSIASYLPSSTVHDDAAFSGMTSHPARLTLTPLQEAANCKMQAEKQLADAEQRNFAWAVEDSVELGDEDAEGEDEGEDGPGYVKHPDGYYVEVDSISPIGVRNQDGDIEALPVEQTAVQFAGVPEYVPKHLHEIVAKQMPGNSDLEETQPLLLTPINKATRRASSLSSAAQSTLSSISTAPSINFDPEMLKNMNLGAREDRDTEMLELETQVLPGLSLALESIQSFTEDALISTTNDTVGQQLEIKENGLQCDCGILLEDESCFCEGGCRKWFHVWCMGYHATDDKRMPSNFICFDCRVRADMTWELIKFDLYPRMVSKSKDLALFRRAIKVAQDEAKFTSFQFSKAFGGDVTLGGEMLKRLEDEGFVLQESTMLDDMGLTVTNHSRKGKNKGGKGTAKHAKTRKNMQRTRYVFNRDILTDDQYLDYFKPDDQEVESRLLGVPEMTKEWRTAKYATNSSKLIDLETQTQEETQETTMPQNGMRKRPLPQDEPDVDLARPKKKVKMSLAMGVDLAE